MACLIALFRRIAPSKTALIDVSLAADHECTEVAAGERNLKVRPLGSDAPAVHDGRLERQQGRAEIRRRRRRDYPSLGAGTVHDASPAWNRTRRCRGGASGDEVAPPTTAVFTASFKVKNARSTSTTDAEALTIGSCPLRGAR